MTLVRSRGTASSQLTSRAWAAGRCHLQELEQHSWGTGISIPSSLPGWVPEKKPEQWTQGSCPWGWEVPGGASEAAETGAEPWENSLPPALSSAQKLPPARRGTRTQSHHGWGREGLVKGSTPRTCPGQGCSQWYRRLCQFWAFPRINSAQHSGNLSQCPTLPPEYFSIYLDLSLLQLIPLSHVLLLCFPNRCQSLPSPSSPTGQLSLFLCRVTKSSSFSLSLYIRGNVLIALSNVTCLSRKSGKHRAVEAWKSLIIWILVDIPKPLYVASSLPAAATPALLWFGLNIGKRSDFSPWTSADFRGLGIPSSAKWDLTTAKCRRLLPTSFLIFWNRFTTGLHGPHQAWYTSTTASRKMGQKEAQMGQVRHRPCARRAGFNSELETLARFEMLHQRTELHYKITNQE